MTAVDEHAREAILAINRKIEGLETHVKQLMDIVWVEDTDETDDPASDGSPVEDHLSEQAWERRRQGWANEYEDLAQKMQDRRTSLMRHLETLRDLAKNLDGYNTAGARSIIEDICDELTIGPGAGVLDLKGIAEDQARGQQKWRKVAGYLLQELHAGECGGRHPVSDCGTGDIRVIREKVLEIVSELP